MSLYEINYLIKKEYADEANDLRVQEIFLEAYCDLADIFSKAASDTLSPRYLYNHKI
jgi:hypothetical protein